MIENTEAQDSATLEHHEDEVAPRLTRIIGGNPDPEQEAAVEAVVQSLDFDWSTTKHRQSNTPKHGWSAAAAPRSR
ncbi:hypothetical protein [Humidisolicoccus flavus]|uniref:hypothetical protein n=1 Tax=Humidisolicoccus flavus TaxID=3111414 RepID=UPI00324C489A